jgi:hypothetical protein
MLGRRRRQLQETSFAIDAVAGLLLLGLVFGFLLCFAAEWQAILQSLTGYPFRVNEVSHLVDRAWMLLLLPLCMLLALRLTGYYELDPQAPWTTLAKTSLRGTAAGVGRDGAALLPAGHHRGQPLDRAALRRRVFHLSGAEGAAVAALVAAAWEGPLQHAARLRRG